MKQLLETKIEQADRILLKKVIKAERNHCFVISLKGLSSSAKKKLFSVIPEHQAEEDAKAVTEKELGEGHPVFGIQHEHAGEHDEHGYTPARQAVIEIEDLPILRSYRHSGDLPTGQMTYDHGEGGKYPQQIGVGQPPIDFFRHILTPSGEISTNQAILP